MDQLQEMLLDSEVDWTNPVAVQRAVEEAQTKLEIDARRVSRDYRDCFETPIGKRVLGYLVATTLCRPIVEPDATQFAAGINEGRASIVRDILAQIEAGKGDDE